MPLCEPLDRSGAPCFGTTHWSIVLAAGRENSDSQVQALEKLCAAYWYPLYAYARRRGYPAEDAKDLTQAFFASFLEKGYLARADRDRGRFRTFLLRSIENFLHTSRERSNAQKRGGGKEIFSLDAADAEGRYLAEPVTEVTPARLFEKRWAATVIERVLHQLEGEFLINGKAELFSQLEPHLWGDANSVPYAQLAAQLKLTVVAIKSTVYRIRTRCRELLRQEIAQTVVTSEEIDQEIQHLLEVMSE